MVILTLLIVHVRMYSCLHTSYHWIFLFSPVKTSSRKTPRSGLVSVFVRWMLYQTTNPSSSSDSTSRLSSTSPVLVLEPHNFQMRGQLQPVHPEYEWLAANMFWSCDSFESHKRHISGGCTSRMSLCTLMPQLFLPGLLYFVCSAS